MAFQMVLPAKVQIRNFASGIRVIPAGSEIIVRKAGMKRNTNTTHPPCRTKNRCSRSTSRHSIVSQRPYLSTKGRNRS